MTPFSYESRREIGQNQRWTCQRCGRRFQDGWMVECSHLDHTRDDGYDDPCRGEILCKLDHLLFHIELMLDDENDWSYHSVRLSAQSAYTNGLHIYKETTEETMKDDRQEVVSLLESYGLNPDNFL